MPSFKTFDIDRLIGWSIDWNAVRIWTKTDGKKNILWLILTSVDMVWNKIGRRDIILNLNIGICVAA